MMIIRPEKIEDYEEIHKINELAFGGREEGDLIQDLRKTDGFIPWVFIITGINLAE